MSALRTIKARRTAPFTKRWFCEDCGAQVQGIILGSLEVFGTCLCAGWTSHDNPALAETVAQLLTDGAAEMQP